MLYKYRNQLARWGFERRIRDVRHTPPVALGDARSPAVLSLLQHRDVLMYLAAIKSFARALPPGAVHVVNDGSLTDADRALLAAHVPEIVLHSIEDYREPGLPRGGCWERLVAIARLSESRYVIQLDADTLTLGGIDEVASAARDGQAFAIATWDKQTLEPVIERARTAAGRIGPAVPHIQLLAEAHFDRLDDAASLRYVRGCAGFSGFQQGTGKLEFMRRVSARMGELLGERWSEWGSEQVMSNLLVANQPEAIALPHPRYADCEKMRPGETRFVHFIGTCRFRRGVYAESVRRILLGGAA